MKALDLATQVLDKIRYTITRDGRFGVGRANYYNDFEQDAYITNPTSFLMVNGSISFPGVTYNGGEDSTTLQLNSSHYAAKIGSGSTITKIILPRPTASILHRTYVLINHKTTAIPVSYTYASQTTEGRTVSANANGTATVSITTAASSNVVYGSAVTVDGGPGTIPANTIVIGISSNRQTLTLSNNVTGLTTSTSLTITNTGKVVANLSALPASFNDNITSAGLLTSANSDRLPLNSIVVQCQRVDVKAPGSGYEWNIISASLSPAFSAGTQTAIIPAPTVYYGGNVTIELVTYQGNTIGRAKEFSPAISITSGNSNGLYLPPASPYQISRAFTAGQTVSVSVNSALLPTGYQFSGWKKITTPASNTNSTNPFTTDIIGAANLNNSTTTTIQLIFTYQPPIVSSSSSSSVKYYTPDPPFTVIHTPSSSPTATVGGCPIPEMKIMIGPNEWQEAGLLEVGQSVWTKHEITGEWGLFKIIENSRRVQPTLTIKVREDLITVSESHKFLTSSGEYKSAVDLTAGESLQTIHGDLQVLEILPGSEKEVVGLEIAEAHTYVVEGALSHNKIYSGGANQVWYDREGGYHYGPIPAGGYYTSTGTFVQPNTATRQTGINFYGSYFGAY